VKALLLVTLLAISFNIHAEAKYIGYIPDKVVIKSKHHKKRKKAPVQYICLAVSEAELMKV